jgi:putative colanic acid biosysnthesis UDP-glucose lipid carrier transferase
MSREFSSADHLPRGNSLRRRRVRIGSAHTPIHSLLHRLLLPAMAAGSLLLTLRVLDTPGGSMHWALALVALLAGSQLLTALPENSGVALSAWLRRTLPRLLLEWGCILLLMVFVEKAMNLPTLLSREVLLAWSVLGLGAIVMGSLAKTHVARALNGGEAEQQRYIIVGANELGMELHRRVSLFGNDRFHGFFDDRAPDRLPRDTVAQLQGKMRDIRAFVTEQGIDAVYITLPVATNDRVLDLIRELRDTTVSVYVVPVIMSLDSIQPRMMEIDGLPVVSIYDTPLHGASALGKRAMDFVCALLALLAIWPLLLLIAVGVKITSPGPVLFKQRRYGLHGEEIRVYKFRSMSVCEDGEQVAQATRGDSRVTPFGSFLRRTSLDELPQVINVLQGRMSLVGPRPHAVAHNEQYRKLIDGYMFRHKVRPGITGWAQVNGLRGETRTVDRMQERVDFDLEYLRSWSLWMDFKIILRTVRLLFRDARAF